MLAISKVFLRRRHILFGLSIGVLIAFIFINVSLLSADYLAAVASMKYLERKNVDYFINARFSSYENLSSIGGILEKDSRVKEYVILSKIWIWPGILTNGSEQEPEIYLTYVYNIFNNDYFRIVNGTNDITGGFAVPYSFALKFNLKIGDNLTISQEYYNGETGSKSYINVTRKVLAVYVSDGLLREALTESYSFSGPKTGYQIIVDWDTFNEITSELFRETGYKTFLSSLYRILVKADKAKLVIPWDIDASIKRVNTHLNNLLAKMSYKMKLISYVNYLKLKLENLRFNAIFLRFMMIFFILPILLLGILQTSMTNWLSLTTQFKDIALLKIRGVGGVRIQLALGLVGLLSGFISGGLGGLIGMVIFPFFIKYFYPNTLKLFDPFLVFSLNGIYYILYSAVLSGVICFIISLYTGKKGLEMDLINMVYEHVEKLDEKISFKLLDFILLLLGSYGIFEILTTGAIIELIRDYSHMEYIFVTYLVIIIFLLELISVFLGPLFFMYGLTKLLASNITGFKKVLKALLKPLVGDLSEVAIKNFNRRPSRTAKVLFILALTFTFTIIYPILTETQKNRDLIDARLAMGSDIRAENLQVPYSFVKNISENVMAINGVKNIVFISNMRSLFTENGWLHAYCVSPEYFQLSSLEDSYLEGVSRADASEIISENGTVILSTSIKNYLEISVGDKISISVFGENDKLKSVTLSVGGFIKFAPGISQGILEFQEGPIILMGNTTYEFVYGEEPIVDVMLIETGEGYNTSSLKDYVTSVMEGLGIYVSPITLNEYLEKRKVNTMSWVLPAMSTFEIYLNTIISTLAIILVMTISIYERKRDIAIQYIKGFEKRDIIKIILSESLLIAALSSIIAVLPALTYSISALLSFGLLFIFGGKVVYPPGYLITIPWYLVPMIVVLLAIYTLSPLIPLFTILKREKLLEGTRIKN